MYYFTSIQPSISVKVHSLGILQFFSPKNKIQDVWYSRDVRKCDFNESVCSSSATSANGVRTSTLWCDYHVAAIVFMTEPIVTILIFPHLIQSNDVGDDGDFEASHFLHFFASRDLFVGDEDLDVDSGTGCGWKLMYHKLISQHKDNK